MRVQVARVKGAARRVNAAILRVGLAYGRLIDDQKIVMECLLELGRVRGEDGQLDDAEGLFAEGRRIAIAQGNQLEVARSGIGLAAIAINRKDYELAVTVLEAELPGLRQVRDHEVLADALLKLGVASDKTGHEERAIAMWEEAVALARAGHDPFRLTEGLMNLGGVAYREQSYTAAERYWTEALVLCRRRHDLTNVAEMSFFLGVVARRLSRGDEARSFVTESRDLYQRVGRPDLAARSATYLATLMDSSPPSEDPRPGS